MIPPELCGVVVKETKFIEFFFHHFLDVVRHHQLLDSLSELLRDGVFVIFLFERESVCVRESKSEKKNKIPVVQVLS